MKTQLKKIKHLWTVMCRNSVVDSVSNNLSINNVLEQLKITAKSPSGENIIPQKGIVVPMDFQIVCFLKRIAGINDTFSLDGEIEIIDPKGETLSKHPFPIIMERGKERVRAIMGFPGLKVTVPGEYVFKLRIREDKENEFVDVDESYLAVQFALN